MPYANYKVADQPNLFMPYANNKVTDQPVCLHSLISTFIVHCLDSIIHNIAISKIRRLLVASVTEQASFFFYLTWLHISIDSFFHDVAHIIRGSSRENLSLGFVTSWSLKPACATTEAS